MRGRTPMYAFNGGELSRRMEGRSDLDGIYDRAVARMLNYVSTVEGPALKRSGFRFIRGAMTSSTFLSRFIFNTTQAYVLEWGEQKIRFYTNGGRLEVDGEAVEASVPYTAEQASRVSQWQSNDRLYLAHGSHAPAMLQRTSASEFSYVKMQLRNGPFKDWNIDKTATIDWSGGTGLVGSTVTLTSNKPIFKAGHVGGAFIFEVHSYSDIKAWEPNVRLEPIAIGEKRRSDGKVYSLVEKVNPSGTDIKIYTGSIQPTHIEGDEWDGSTNELPGEGTNDHTGAKWRYEYDRFGVGTIKTFNNANSVTIEVTRRFPDLPAGTYKWALGAFSDAEGWPHLVCMWAQRLVFFKAGNNGIEVIGSVVGDFFNFSPITSSGLYAPDMAFRRQLLVADPPLWVHPDKVYMLCGSARGELVVGQINQAAGVSSDNLRADPQSAYGSAPVWPVPVGASIIFAQRGGRKIREAEYQFSSERFVGPNLNVYARHITKSGVAWLAFQQEPEEMLWGGRADGTLIAHPHSPEQQIKGFSRVELAEGSVLSGCTIPSPEGELDELWVLAELDGEKGILQLGDWWDEDAGLEQADAFFVDWGVSYDGTELDEAGDPLGPKQTFTTGLDHLEGRTVRILADGAVVEGKVVTGGSLTLPAPATKVHIGLGYQARIKFLRPELRGAPTAQGLRKRVLRFFARLIDSAALKLVDSKGEEDPLFGRDNSLPMGTPAPLFNGDSDNRSTGGGSDFDEVPEILSDDPLPSIIAMAIATYELEELEQ